MFIWLEHYKMYSIHVAIWRSSRGRFWSPASIADGSYQVKPDLSLARGVVSTVLNENFGLVYGPDNVDDDDKMFCLFDTYDLVTFVD
jgi:hypothetical protein